MAQVRGLGTKVTGHLALFCIHRVNRVYGALVVTSWTCYGAFKGKFKNKIMLYSVNSETVNIDNQMTLILSSSPFLIADRSSS